MASDLRAPVDEVIERDATVPGDMTGFRALLHEYRPSVVTGGAALTPLVLFSLLNLADELDTAAFGVLLPEIRDYFGVSLGAILAISSFAGLLPLLLAVPVGYLSDRINRIRMAAAGAATWGVFSVLTGLASTVPMLGLARLGSGLGKVLDPSAQAVLSDYYPPDRRAGVFSLHRLGNALGLMIAPALSGFLAAAFFWQLPFIVFGAPSMLLAVVVFAKLRDPARGGQERRALGMSDEDVAIEEPPPGWIESWRIAKGVRTLRRVWMALPFLVGGSLGFGALASSYFDEVFNVSPTGRGVLASVSVVWGIVGLLVGLSIGNRLLERSPSRIPLYSAALSVATAVAYVVIAVAPSLWIAVLVGWMPAFVNAIFPSMTGALVSLVIPPRARGFALAAGALFVAPGVLFIPVAGIIGDIYGLRIGMLVMAPVFFIGAVLIASAAPSVEADMRAAMASAAAATETKRSREAGREKLVVCRDVDVHYGQVQILFNVDFDVERGEIVALLGTNGAGKSTLLNAISGGVAPSNGAVYFEGEDITFLPASDHVTRGIVMVPGGKGVFPGLTVGENLTLATWPIEDGAERQAAVEEVLGLFPILRERLGEPAAALSGGEQQMLTLGQAFIAKPRLLMIDELSLGLAPVVVEHLLEVVRAIHAQGTTIVLVEQSVNIALTVAQRAVFMEKGEVTFDGPAADLLQLPDVLRSVFLAGAGQGASARRREQARYRPEELEAVLEVEGVAVAFGGVQALDGASVVLREGEILGIIGPNGAGKTTLFDVISGFVTPDAGTVRLLGQDITDLSPDARARLGLQRSFQDARLFPNLTVEENLLCALDRHLAVKNAAMAGLRLPNVNRAELRLRKRAERLINLLNLQPFRDKFVRELSTGSRRVVDLACVLGTDPQVLLLDEPSSGVAQRETEELGPLINRIKSETDCAILVIEHDMTLIASVSDELIAMELGGVVTRGRPSEVLEDPRVVRAYLGTSEEAIHRSGT